MIVKYLRISYLIYKKLVLSHACGTGNQVPCEIVKIMLLLKVQSLAYGHSGVQLTTIDRLVDMFNNNILPVIFKKVVWALVETLLH